MTLFNWLQWKAAGIVQLPAGVCQVMVRRSGNAYHVLSAEFFPSHPDRSPDDILRQAIRGVPRHIPLIPVLSTAHQFTVTQSSEREAGIADLGDQLPFPVSQLTMLRTAVRGTGDPSGPVQSQANTEAVRQTLDQYSIGPVICAGVTSPAIALASAAHVRAPGNSNIIIMDGSPSRGFVTALAGGLPIQMRVLQTVPEQLEAHLSATISATRAIHPEWRPQKIFVNAGSIDPSELPDRLLPWGIPVEPLDLQAPRSAQYPGMLLAFGAAVSYLRDGVRALFPLPDRVRVGIVSPVAVVITLLAMILTGMTGINLTLKTQRMMAVRDQWKQLEPEASRLRTETSEIRSKMPDLFFGIAPGQRVSSVLSTIADVMDQTAIRLDSVSGNPGNITILGISEQMPSLMAVISDLEKRFPNAELRVMESEKSNESPVTRFELRIMARRLSP